MNANSSLDSVRVKERPILFSGPMVLALLTGRKTQTRRAVKWKPREEGLNLSASSLSVGYYCTGVPSSGFVLCSRGAGDCWNDRTYPLHCPYGQPGDRLWVRETSSQSPLPNLLTGEPTNAMCAVYAADSEPVLNERGFDLAWWYSRPTCPGIHMPRFACRLVLEVKAVRVERLQAISGKDAIAEGIELDAEDCDSYGALGCDDAARDKYRSLWDSLNDERGYGWATNPWVWVIEFKRTKESAMAIAA